VRPLRLVAMTFVSVLCALSCLMSSAHAQIAFSPCGQSNDFACGHLTVALDPNGGVPGTVTLAIRRHRAAVGEGRSAIIALAGGPGQPAVPLTEEFKHVLGPLAATRDLVVFDQRGIGFSDALSCHASERPDLFTSFGSFVEACGGQLGAGRSFYASEDTVADIEAIRQAGGYEKLVLYGTSYGTKVAELYARRFPGHVEGLVLDSVVTPDGPEPLEQSTFAAVPRILRQICAVHACAHITANPVADLTRLVARVHRAPLRSHAIGPNGHPHEVSVSAPELVGALLAGDFSPGLRAELVTATSAAVRGDNAPLARLFGRAPGGGGGEPEDFDAPLFLATTCEDEPFPWNRTSSPHERLTQLAAAARALPASAFTPFTAADALRAGDSQACAFWPYATPTPAVERSPLPAVPSLILSGTEDLRTPTADARAVAAEIPGSHLLIVPGVGHSVLTTESSTPCAREALRAMFDGRAPRPCQLTPTPPLLRPPPLPPRRLAAIAPERGSSGTPGRALHAVALTLADLARGLVMQLIASASEAGPLSLPTLRVGGLRAGWAEIGAKGVILNGYSYVPGVALTGSLERGAVDLHVLGSAALSGTLRNGSHGSIVGTLGGQRVVLPASSRATAAIVGSDAQVRLPPGPGSAGIRAAVGRLARTLAGSRG
jgi:pimeloyl-ACP methyl ester carboxylesterase